MTTPATDATSAAPLTAASPTVQGRFLWYDLMTPDVDAAIAFYTAVTGWSTSKWEMGEGMPPYTLWVNGESMIGGTMGLPPDAVANGAPPHWLAYVGADDCDATYAQALALGARSYVPPSDIPTVGRYAVLADPQGAAFALYTPTNAPPAWSMPKLGEIAWHELMATELEPAFAFYQQLFGWEKTQAMDMGPMGTYQMYGQGDLTYGGMYGHGSEGRSSWLLYIFVDDLEAAMERVRAHGGTVTNGPMDVPGGRVAQCRDPQGGAFALNAMSAPAPG